MNYLVDTNVLSELRKHDRADSRVVGWFRERKAEELFLSVLTIGELQHGVERIRRRDSASAETLEKWLRRTVQAYNDRIIGVDMAIAQRWGHLGIPAHRRAAIFSECRMLKNSESTARVVPFWRYSVSLSSRSAGAFFQY